MENPGISVERAAELIAAATAETKEKSVAAIVNARTQEAFRLRTEGGGAPDHGQIAVDALNDFDVSPETMQRGKAVMGRLIALLQQELGATPRVFFPSQYLDVPELRAIATRIWLAAPQAAGIG